MKIGLIFGDQLWSEHPIIEKVDKVIMVESYDFCAQSKYHKLKLAYVFTMMREYADKLRQEKVEVMYTTVDRQQGFAEVYRDQLNDGDEAHFVTPHDKPFAENIRSHLNGFKIQEYQSKSFVTPPEIFETWLHSKFGHKRLLMADFYKDQRKRLNILVDSDGKPFGGQWSYDEHNRQKLKKKDPLPIKALSFSSKHWHDVCYVIEELFPDYPGQLENAWLPFTTEQAETYLAHFIENSLYDFGTYEDALSQRDHLLYHSGLSTALNYGLLTPDQVVKAVLLELQKFDLETDQGKRMLYSCEGIIRQIIGWREWIKGLYDHVYTDEIIDKNFFDAQQKLPDAWWSFDSSSEVIEGNTPLIEVFNKIDQYAYAHHIERLMVLANWMTLHGYEPKECYHWFRNSFIDAFDWVMVPNVYGMGLFSDGGIFATKPYVAGGNYIKKMSDYSKGDWEQVWTEAFWSFLFKYEEFFMKQPRMAMLLKQKKKKLEL